MSRAAPDLPPSSAQSAERRAQNGQAKPSQMRLFHALRFALNRLLDPGPGATGHADEQGLTMPSRQRGDSPLTLTLVCHDAPPTEHDGQAMEFGAQDKAGTLHSGSSATGRTVRFSLSVTARVGADGSTLDFAGPFIHGPPAGRFCYLGYRPLGSTAWTRRWKIPLVAITSAQVAAAQAAGRALVAHFSATSGSTVQLLGGGWAVAGDDEPV
jgi:hypothetical protein